VLVLLDDVLLFNDLAPVLLDVGGGLASAIR
jgi:hypothetical protein